jgi:hypothetical protein
MVAVKLTDERIYQEIMREAKVLNMQAGAAEIIAKKVTEAIIKWGKNRAAVTEVDLNQRLAKETKKFNADLAYLFESKNKII